LWDIFFYARLLSSFVWVADTYLAVRFITGPFDKHLLLERELFIGTQCSNLYTAVDTPARAA
jgi:hypothetical protein